MSARELEDFIRVIETAERLSSHRTDRSSVVKSPTSSLWSYPTDIYHGNFRLSAVLINNTDIAAQLQSISVKSVSVTY